MFQKRFIPEEISIQERHDGASKEIDRKTVVANLTNALEGSTIKRRKLVGLSLGIGLGALAFHGVIRPATPTGSRVTVVLFQVRTNGSC